MIGDIIDVSKWLVDKFFPDDATNEQKAAASIALAAEIQKRDEAKAAIITAEMNQGDNFTKRARPMVVYAGLVMITINYVIFPLIGRFTLMYGSVDEAIAVGNIIAPLSLPGEFWAAWGGIVSTWVLGRSYEKHGNQGNLGKLASLITGKG